MTFPSRFALCTLATLLLAALPVQAEVRYLSSAQFDAAAQLRGSDTFADLPVDSQIAGPLLRKAGDFGYQVEASAAGFYAFSNAQGGVTLSTEALLSSISLNHFAPGVNALALDLSALNFYGLAREGAVIGLSIVDTLGLQTTRELTLGSGSAFLSFVSTAPLASVSFTVLDHASPFGDYVSPGLAQLSLAQATVSAVPEPSQAALAALGLLALACRLRRRAG